MPFDLTFTAMSWLISVLFLAGIVRGYSGFGFSALVVTAAGLVTSPLHFVPVVVFIEVALSAQMMRALGPQVDWRRVAYLGMGVLLGLPLGLWALTALPEDGARLVLALFTLGVCGLLWAGFKIAERRGAGVNIAVGGVSGMANAAGMGGMPVAAFFAAQSLPAPVFRATLVAFFPLLDGVSLPLYWAYGLISVDSFWAILWALPAALLGNALGAQLFGKSQPRDFRLLILALLIGLALLALLKSVLNLVG